MEQTVQTLQTILAIAGGITVVGGAWTVISKWIAPATKLVQRVKTLEQDSKQFHETSNMLVDENKLMLRAMMNLLRHEIDGNHVDQLAKIQADIENYLVAK